MIKIVECPRDAMQGIKKFIPTEKKVQYINQLLKVGFDTIDFGSFVSPKAVPQMKDTAEVLSQLDMDSTNSELLTIIANKRGAEDAAKFEEITYLGYPFSISETFQQRNTNASIEESLQRVEEIQHICKTFDKHLVVYISMAFGNPYDDPWNPDIAAKWIKKLSGLDIGIFALADTIGVAKPETIRYLFSTLIPEFPGLEIGAHFHTSPDTWKEKIETAYTSGCRRFDAAIKGYGGCPMAKDKLVGNMATENLTYYFKDKKEGLNIDEEAFQGAMELASVLFPEYAGGG